MGFILHSSLCGAIIQCVAETMLILHQILVIAEESLHSIEAFSPFYFALPVPVASWLGVGTGFGGDLARRDDPT